MFVILTSLEIFSVLRARIWKSYCILQRERRISFTGCNRSIWYIQERKWFHWMLCNIKKYHYLWLLKYINLLGSLLQTYSALSFMSTYWSQWTCNCLPPLLIRRELGTQALVLFSLLVMQEEAWKSLYQKDFPCSKIKHLLFKYTVVFALDFCFCLHSKAILWVTHLPREIS